MRKKVAIIGGGTSALFLASFLDTDLFEVTIYEKKGSLGRKFLVAGDGGFNLTYSESISKFKSRYTPTEFLDPALDCFSSEDLRSWLLSIGIPTFVGSSRRVFPESGIKPIEVLKAIQEHLQSKGVQFLFNKTFTNWDQDQVPILNSEERVEADYVVFALGGASWKVTGSDGAWHKSFQKQGLDVVPFSAANCAYKVQWSEEFIDKFEGEPLKNLSITIDRKKQKGEVVITKFGIEGNAIYGLSPEIQTRLQSNKEAKVYLDFKPMLDLDQLVTKMKSSKSNTTTTLKEKVKLPKAVIALLKSKLSKSEFLDEEKLAIYIKSFPLIITEAAEIDEAISTAGGLSLSAVDSNFELKKMPEQFCIGEMLDWNAPTGGFLIQACASQGVLLAQHLNKSII